MQPAGPVSVLTLPCGMLEWPDLLCRDSPRALAFSAALPIETCLQSPWIFLVTLGK